MKVFLGGTCPGWDWRGEIIPRLKCDYFNPVVKDWTPECVKNENHEKQICGIHLYVITSAMKGPYSIAEAVNDSNRMGKNTIVCIIYDGFSEEMKRSLKACEDMIFENGATIIKDFNAISDYLNQWQEFDDFIKSEQEQIKNQREKGE